MRRRISDRFVADGARRIAAAERARIEREFQARYADAFLRAGFLRRPLLRVGMWLAIERELARTLKRAAPRDALY